MLIIISPAKTLDTTSDIKTKLYSEPELHIKTKQLVSVLAKKDAKSISKLMGISQNLGQLNYERYQGWNSSNALKRQAIFTFNGEVYSSLKIQDFDDDEIAFAQLHLLILSGLYGVLKPLDLIQPYRLEMGTKLKINRKNDLYDFWKKPITDSINKLLVKQGDPILINLASAEYFNVIDISRLKAKIITPVFKDYSGGEYKVLSFFAKKARGLMTRFIIKNKINDSEKLILFNDEGYIFNVKLSSPNQPVFTRN